MNWHENRQAPLSLKTIRIILLALVASLAGWAGLRLFSGTPDVASARGRLEATAVEIVTTRAGRLEEILVHEGDVLQAGQTVARLKVDVVEARRQQARAQLLRSSNSVISAQAQVTVRECEKAAAQAVVAERDSELDSAQRRLRRSEILAQAQITSAQELDDDRARVRHSEAALRAAQAQVAAAQAAIEAAEAEMVGAKSAATAAYAALTQMEADTNETELRTPRNGRVQACIARRGDLLGPGGKVLSLIDSSDLYVSFAVPENTAKKLVLGSEVRVSIDAAPDRIFSAKVAAITFQPIPQLGLLEYRSATHGPIYRVKARIPREVAQDQLSRARGDASCMAWLKLNPQAPWPKAIASKRFETCASSPGS